VVVVFELIVKLNTMDQKIRLGRDKVIEKLILIMLIVDLQRVLVVLDELLNFSLLKSSALYLKPMPSPAVLTYGRFNPPLTYPECRIKSSD